MRLIDGDKLLNEIKKTDLEFMQQEDIIECLEDIVEKQIKNATPTKIAKDEIIDYLILIGITKEEFVRTYDRYLWNIQYCKNLRKRNRKAKVVKTETSSQACPICKSNVNSNFCPNCGQRLEY